jgi:hypothetical protein
MRSFEAAEGAVGDIAVCRTVKYLFSHRVVGRGQRDGRAYILTRPDRARSGGNVRTFDDDLLGVVVRIDRHDVAVPLEAVAHSWIQRCYLRVRLVLLEAEHRAHLRLSAVAMRVQEWRLYRIAAGGCWLRTHPCVRFVVRVPVNTTMGEAVCREVASGTFDPRATWHGRPLDGWTLTAYVREIREPAVWMRLARGPDDAWRTEESHALVRYRGTGLDEAVLRSANAGLARSGTRTERTT